MYGAGVDISEAIRLVVHYALTAYCPLPCRTVRSASGSTEDKDLVSEVRKSGDMYGESMPQGNDRLCQALRM